MIKDSNKIYMLASEAAKILRRDPQAIRSQAQKDPAKLGFPVCVIGRRVRIPREAFWAAMRGKSITTYIEREK